MSQSRASASAGIMRAAGAAICAALMIFYVVGASEHGRRVNTSKARGDQSGYLWDAENIYANWHGRQPPAVIGERNRMPLYAGYLALFYRTGLSDPDFFEVGKRANIYLSLGLLIVLAMFFARELPLLPAVNLTGIVAFGYFVFKAGYTQSELLFYFLLFLTFLGCWHLLRDDRACSSIVLAVLTGAVAGLAHLTKAALLPFVAIFLASYLAQPVARLAGGFRPRTKDSRARDARALVVGLAFIVVFFAVLSPYLSTSKRVFGHYLYNVNSTFYVWYDDWAHASVGTYAHGDGIGWPTMPEADLPGPGRYWREHTIEQIGRRMASGFKDMAVQSYRTYDYLQYLLAYGVMLGIVLATRGRAVRAMIRAHAPLAAFLVAYAALYLLAIAFYFPTSGTGTGRFFLAHLTPLFFALSYLFSRDAITREPWRIAGQPIGMGHFNAIMLGMLALDIAFRTWPRLMTTYGGF